LSRPRLKISPETILANLSKSICSRAFNAAWATKRFSWASGSS